MEIKIAELVRDAVKAFRPWFRTEESAEAAALRCDRVRSARAYAPNLFRSIEEPGGLETLILALDGLIAGRDVLVWDKSKPKESSSPERNDGMADRLPQARVETLED